MYHAIYGAKTKAKRSAVQLRTHLYIKLIYLLQIYVQENNIYYLKDIRSEETIEITTDGEIDQIYNGIPDWLYEGMYYKNCI